MYPQTLVKIVDNSDYNARVINSSDRVPIAMVGFASDRGSEDLTDLVGEDWFDMYGHTLHFAKYGQPLIQAGKMIEAGARLYSKRVVAPDAKLANQGVYAHLLINRQVVEDSPAVPAVPSTGPGDPGTPAIPAVTHVETDVTIKYNSLCVSTTSNDMKDLERQFKAALPTSTESDIVIPLFVIASAGRGKWAPRWRITPNYRFSRSAGCGKYVFEVLDDDDPNDPEEIVFAINPNKIERKRNVSFGMTVEEQSLKTRVGSFDDQIELLYHTIEAALDLQTDSLADTDILFGCDIKGTPIQGITIDTSEFNLQNVAGNLLQNGDNGAFGDFPLDTDEYSSELVKLFNGTYAEEIYNLDAMGIDFIVDGNYPRPVKRAIEEFVTFREDCFFMRDMGLDITGIMDIEDEEFYVLHNRYSSSYCNSVTVKDDETFKYIDVTITYLLAPLLVTHFINGCNRPFAGIRYDVFWGYGDVIKKGSINFLPRVTNRIDEKQKLEDLGVNYVSIYSGTRVVMETLYTAQHVDRQTQLSFSCNVWSIQQVVKLLRERCPQSRYAFMRGEDLEEYQEDMRSELSNISANFVTFDLAYMGDKAYENAKIYYATLTVSFPDFVQAEYFKIVAIPNT